MGEAAPDARDPARLVRLVREDEQFRQALVGDDRVFRQVVEDEEILVKISPALYFEVLLRRAAKDMETATHTLERTGSQSIPVFDTDEVVELLSLPGVLLYLSQMLASFTRISSQVTSVRVRRGIRRRVRHNDLDIDSLMGRLGGADEEQRFGLYRRIADVCLFLSGIFPAYAPCRPSVPVRRAEAHGHGPCAAQPGGLRTRRHTLLRAGCSASPGALAQAVRRAGHAAHAVQLGAQAAGVHRGQLHAVGPRFPLLRASRAGLGPWLDEQGREDQGDHRHQLDQDVESRAGRVLERIAHGVSHHGGLVGFRSLAA